MYSYFAQASHNGLALSAGIFSADLSNKARASACHRFHYAV
jgi:hypothetical protein